MRVLVSGGGSGGHIYPALAIATQLREEYQAEILFLGSDDGLETAIVPAAGDSPQNAMLHFCCACLCDDAPMAVYDISQFAVNALPIEVRL